MRLWSIHPKHLDQKGLTALWREALLAQAVLLGKTKGYKNHSQLIRFKEYKDPVAAIGKYLLEVQEQASIRGYNYNKDLIVKPNEKVEPKETTTKQLEFEIQHLLNKLYIRSKDPEHILNIELLLTGKYDIDPHPMFSVVEGDIEPWEKL